MLTLFFPAWVHHIEGMQQDAEDSTRERGKGQKGVDADWKRPSRQLLTGVARVYFDVYHQQRLKDFWGLREFYAAVRALGVGYVLGEMTSNPMCSRREKTRETFDMRHCNIYF